MFKNILFNCILCIFLASLTACSTTDEPASAIVEETSADPITNVEDGVIIVGDDYISENDKLQLTAEQRRKLEALKQDSIIYFGYDSDAIPNAYVALLQAHAELLREAPQLKIIIEGHTDERGTPEYNVALGDRRSRSVARYLLQLGVSAEQMSIVSYGEEKPLVGEHNEAAWSKNRRAVITY
ncbi:MAG: peptidoglycan-associated lipoprotein Pal [Succinivibrionaceae bacterium]